MAAGSRLRSLGSFSLTAAAAAAAAVLVWVAILAAPPDGIDFRVYRLGGQSVIDASGELYTRSIPNGDNPPLMFSYPPFAAMMFTVFAPFGDAVGFLLFRILNLALTLLASCWLVGFVAGRHSVRRVLADPWLRPAAILTFGMVAALGPWRETTAFGQINIVLFMLVLGDLLGSRRAGWPTGFLTGVAAGIKLTPFVFGLYFLIRGDWRGLRNMAFGFLSTFGLGFLILPRESRLYWTELLPDTDRIGGPGYVDNLSLRGALAHLAGPESAAAMTVWIVLAGAAALAAAVVIRRSGAAGRQVTALAVTALLMLLVSPVSWSHHWVWVALLLAVLLRDGTDLPVAAGGLRRWAGVLVGTGLVIFYLSPKKTALLLGAGDLDAQQPSLWLVLASLGVAWGAGTLAWFVLAYRRQRQWAPAADPAQQRLPGKRQSAPG